VHTRSIPEAEIVDKTKAIVADKDHGNRLYNKHCYGQPMPGGGLELTLLESAYLLEQNRIKVAYNGSALDFKRLLDHITHNTDVNFHRYIAYRDLKSRGFIVKFTSLFDFSLYPGGVPIRNARSKNFVEVFSERQLFFPDRIHEKVMKSQQLRKEYLALIVDEEGDITYYRISIPEPKGNVSHTSLKRRVRGTLLGGNVVVFNSESLSEFFEREFIGQVRGATHQLSLVEGVFLLKKEMLTVVAHIEGDSKGEAITYEQFMEFAKKYETDLAQKYALYEELKERDLIVKTGFKYGAYFRAYRDNPEESHAEYLFHLLPTCGGTSWPDISRSVRVAHGVRKKMIFAFWNEDEDMQYLMVQRVKPYC